MPAERVVCSPARSGVGRCCSGAASAQCKMPAAVLVARVRRFVSGRIDVKRFDFSRRPLQLVVGSADVHHQPHPTINILIFCLFFIASGASRMFLAIKRFITMSSTTSGSTYAPA
jgi:hypothetical protein